jgi:hypothetical protein
VPSLPLTMVILPGTVPILCLVTLEPYRCTCPSYRPGCDAMFFINTSRFGEIKFLLPSSDFLLPERLEYQILPKLWYLPSRLHGVTYQKTVVLIFTAIGTTDPTHHHEGWLLSVCTVCLLCHMGSRAQPIEDDN